MGYKNNLLFCAVDIGGRIELYSKYLKKQYPKARVDSFVKFKVPEKQEKTNYTYYFSFDQRKVIMQYFISISLFIYSLFKYKTIYIISGENILPRKLLKLELWCYNILNKNIVMHFVGADIRNSEYLTWMSNDLLDNTKSSSPPKQTAFQKKLCFLAQQKATFIIVTSPDLISFFNPTKKVLYIPVFINVDKFLSRTMGYTKDNEKQIILHAPSNTLIKGTGFISLVLDKIKAKNKDINVINTSEDKYRENIHPPYTVSKDRIYELLAQSNILIDQIIIGWYGMQSIEGLLSSNITICRIEKELLKYLPKHCPIICYSENDELENVINKTITSIAMSDAINNIDWVKKYHTIENNKEINNVFSTLFKN